MWPNFINNDGFKSAERLKVENCGFRKLGRSLPWISTGCDLKNIFLLDPYPSSKEGKLDFKNPQIGLLKKAQKKVELWQLIQENCDL